MKTLTQNIGVVAAVIMIALAVFVYKSVFSTDLELVAPELPTNTIGSEALETLSALQRTTLDQSVLSSTGYQGLSDFSVAVPSQVTGRPNPFDAIGK